MNYKMRPEVGEQILNHVKMLAKRRVEYVLGAFPLIHQEVARAVMTERQLELATDLQNSGFTQFRSNNTVSIYVDRTEYPDMRRSAVVHLALPEYILQPRQVFLQFRRDLFTGEQGLNEIANLYRLRLDDSQKAQLAQWCNKIIRETRLHDMMIWTATKVLERCPTTGHVLALWPTLATFVQ